MLKSRFNLWVMCVLLFSVLSGFGQTTPCQAGTLAGVLGTSCSVGPVIFNFQADSNGFFAVFNVASGPVLASDIGFIPLQEDGRAGFKLVLNFIDEAAPGGFHVLILAILPRPPLDLKFADRDSASMLLPPAYLQVSGLLTLLTARPIPTRDLWEPQSSWDLQTVWPSGNQTSECFSRCLDSSAPVPDSQT